MAIKIYGMREMKNVRMRENKMGLPISDNFESGGDQ